MAEAPAITMAAATLALPDAPVARAGLQLALAPPALRLSLRARDPEVLSQAAGLALPARIGDFSHGIACLGPDEWLAILPPDAVVGSAEGLPLSIVDVSSRSIGILVSGPGAVAAISAGCPLDLARIAPGRATRTVFETVEIILIRTSDQVFHIEVWCSFAPWLFAALELFATGKNHIKL